MVREETYFLFALFFVFLVFVFCFVFWIPPDAVDLEYFFPCRITCLRVRRYLTFVYEGDGGEVTNQEASECVPRYGASF